MKDYIDVGFMKLFYPEYLFKDYKEKGYAEPVDNNELWEEESKEIQAKAAPIKENIQKISAEEAGKLMSQGEEETEFFPQLYILDRMARDADFAKGVIENFKPTYLE